jgi:hypothetical protein
MKQNPVRRGAFSLPTALSTMEASAVVYARGVYRAGCVATPGRAVVAGHPVGRAAVVAPRRGSLSAVDRTTQQKLSGRFDGCFQYFPSLEPAPVFAHREKRAGGSVLRPTD